jgi:hypothetical protein
MPPPSSRPGRAVSVLSGRQQSNQSSLDSDDEDAEEEEPDEWGESPLEARPDRRRKLRPAKPAIASDKIELSALVVAESAPVEEPEAEIAVAAPEEAAAVEDQVIEPEEVEKIEFTCDRALDLQLKRQDILRILQYRKILGAKQCDEALAERLVRIDSGKKRTVDVERKSFDDAKKKSATEKKLLAKGFDKISEQRPIYFVCMVQEAVFDDDQQSYLVDGMTTNVRLKCHRGPASGGKAYNFRLSMISDEPFQTDEFSSWKHAAMNLKRSDDEFEKKYVIGGSDLIMAKKKELKAIFDFEWKHIGQGKDDKGETWISEQVAKIKNKIDAKWLVQRQCELTNEIAVLRSKQQRTDLTENDEQQLAFFQNEMAKLRNAMTDVREKYKKDNPRTYGIVDINERNIRWMLEDEKKERIRYKKEEAEQAKIKASGKEADLNPFMRVPMVPKQLWMTGSTAKEKMAIKKALADKEAAEKAKKDKKAPTPQKDGDGKAAVTGPPAKSVELQRADAKAKSFLAAYAYDGPVDFRALDDMQTGSAAAGGSGTPAADTPAQADTPAISNGGNKTGTVLTMGDLLNNNIKRRKLQ